MMMTTLDFYNKFFFVIKVYQQKWFKMQGAKLLVIFLKSR